MAHGEEQHVAPGLPFERSGMLLSSFADRVVTQALDRQPVESEFVGAHAATLAATAYRRNTSVAKAGRVPIGAVEVQNTSKRAGRGTPAGLYRRCRETGEVIAPH